MAPENHGEENQMAVHRQETADVHGEEGVEHIGMVQKFIVEDNEASVTSRKKKWLWQIATGGDTSETWELTVSEEREAVIHQGIHLKFIRDKEKEFDGMLKQEVYTYKQPFRGCLEDMRDPGKYEVFSMDGHNEWFPATLTKYRDDGRYSCVVKVPNNDHSADDDEYGQIEEKEYPVVDVQFIRNASDKKPAEGPGTEIQLDLKKTDPWNPMLTMNGKNWRDVGLFVPIPRPGKEQKDFVFKVDKHYEQVTCDLSHEMLMTMTDNAVHRISEVNKDKVKHSWTINFSAAGIHTISIEVESSALDKVKDKIKAPQEKEFKLHVDDDLVVSCSSEEFGTGSLAIELSFTFLVKILFKVHELEHGIKSTGNIVDRESEKEWDHKISIVSDLKDLTKAELKVDKKAFNRLPLWKKHWSEDTQASASVEMLEHECGIVVPRAGAESEGFMAEIQAMWQEFKDWIPHDRASLHRASVDVGLACGCTSTEKNNKAYEVNDAEDDVRQARAAHQVISDKPKGDADPKVEILGTKLPEANTPVQQ